MSFLGDLASAFRSLRRDRPTLLGSILCLGLGIGVTAPLFSALDLLFLRPPAGLEDPGSLRRLRFLDSPAAQGGPSTATSYPSFADLRDGVSGFSGLAGYFAIEMPVGSGGQAAKVQTAFVTSDYLSVLGVRPVRGRPFTTEEASADGPHPIALVREGSWSGALGEGGEIGETLWIGGGRYTVVGVLPRDMRGLDLRPVEVWLPVNAAEALLLGPGWQNGRGSSFLEIVARLKPGTGDEAAGQEATAVYRQAWAAAGKPLPEARVLLEPLRAAGSLGPSQARFPLWLSGMSLLVLGIGGGNAAALLLVRTLRRRRDLAVRLAVGAGRGRLLGAVGVEALVLAALGGLGALWLSFAVHRSIQAAVLPSGAATAGLDFRSLAVLLVLVLGTGLLCGLAASFRILREDLAGVLRAASTDGALPSRLRFSLLAGQVALTLVLAAVAGLFLGSFRRAADLDLGLDTDRVLLATVDADSAGLPVVRQAATYQEALERVTELPGVERAALAAQVPFLSSFAAAISVPGRELPGLPGGGPYLNAVSEDYFRTLGIPLRQGRSFEAGDRAGAGSVAVVDETFARLAWPGRTPLGECVRLGGEADAPCVSVVGVVADSRRSGLREEAAMQVYIPLRQAPPDLGAKALLVRVAEGGGPAAAQVRTAFPAGAAAPVLVEVRALSDLLAPQLRPWRVGAALLSLFSVLALALVAVGIYAALAQRAAERSREIGLRLALGARRWDVLRLIWGETAAVTVLGALLGGVVVLSAARYLQPLLYEVPARNPRILAAATGLILAIAFLASWLPGRQALRVDPASILREE